MASRSFVGVGCQCHTETDSMQVVTSPLVLGHELVTCILQSLQWFYWATWHDWNGSLVINLKSCVSQSLLPGTPVLKDISMHLIFKKILYSIAK